MSRDLDGVDDVLLNNTDPVGAYPFFFFIWFNPDTEPVLDLLIFLGDKDVNNVQYTLRTRDHDSEGLNETELTARNTTDRLIQGATHIGTGSWVNTIGAWRSATDREYFINNISQGTDTISVIFSANVDRIAIGRFASLNPSSTFDGQLAQFAICTTEPTANQKAALNRGANPFITLFNNTLKIFVDCWGNESPEPDISGNNLDLTVTGAIRGTTNPAFELMENHL